MVFHIRKIKRVALRAPKGSRTRTRLDLAAASTSVQCETTFHLGG